MSEKIHSLPMTAAQFTIGHSESAPPPKPPGPMTVSLMTVMLKTAPMWYEKLRKQWELDEYFREQFGRSIPYFSGTQELSRDETPFFGNYKITDEVPVKQLLERLLPPSYEGPVKKARQFLKVMGQFGSGFGITAENSVTIRLPYCQALIAWRAYKALLADNMAKRAKRGLDAINKSARSKNLRNSDKTR